MARTKGRPKKPSVDTTPVRIESDIASKAKYLAARRGVTITELLSGMLRAQVEREFDKAGESLMKPKD
jgi:hypothetical protein